MLTKEIFIIPLCSLIFMSAPSLATADRHIDESPSLNLTLKMPNHQNHSDVPGNDDYWNYWTRESAQAEAQRAFLKSAGDRSESPRNFADRSDALPSSRINRDGVDCRFHWENLVMSTIAMASFAALCMAVPCAFATPINHDQALVSCK